MDTPGLREKIFSPKYRYSFFTVMTKGNDYISRYFKDSYILNELSRLIIPSLFLGFFVIFFKNSSLIFLVLGFIYFWIVRCCRQFL